MSNCFTKGRFQVLTQNCTRPRQSKGVHSLGLSKGKHCKSFSWITGSQRSFSLKLWYRSVEFKNNLLCFIAESSPWSKS